MSRISKLNKLSNAGIFADTGSNLQPLPFRKLNLIYGFNGSGKSTLSRIFSSLEAGSLSPKLPPNCTFEVEFDDGKKMRCPEDLKVPERQIAVFNNDYIEQKFHWSEGKAESVFYMGTEQSDAARELSTLEPRIPNLRFRSESAAGRVKSTQKALKDFKKVKAKKTAEKLHLGNRRYEARQLHEDYTSWKSLTLSELDPMELEQAEEIRRRAEPLPQVSELKLDAIPFQDLLLRVSDICQMSIGQVALEEIQKFPDMLLWLNAGYDFHKKGSQERCLFCGNRITEERMLALGDALGSQIDDFLNHIHSLIDEVEKSINSVYRIISSQPRQQELAASIKKEYAEEQVALSKALGAAERFLKKLVDDLKKKQAKPSVTFEDDELPEKIMAEKLWEELVDRINSVNAIIDQHNSEFMDFTNLQKQAGVKIRKHFIAQCRDDYTKLLDDDESASHQAQTAHNDYSQASTRAEALRQQIRTHGPAAETINKVVESYLGHSELTIEALEEGYGLRRFGRPIDGTPSEGEKTAIAISYFLASLESEGRKLKDLTVVVDDPVSSLDTKALNYACSLIRNRLSGAKQIFVLTHNQQCLNEFRKHWKKHSRTEEDKPPTASLFFVDVKFPEGSVSRRSSLIELPHLLREYDSEYHFLFSRVLEYSNSRGEYSEHGYIMPNVLRRVLEIFLAFRCPGSSGLAPKLDQIWKQHPDLDRDRLNALERLSQVESHSENLDDLVLFSSMTIEESRDATATLLYMMDHVDKSHTNALKKLCK